LPRLPPLLGLALPTLLVQRAPQGGHRVCVPGGGCLAPPLLGLALLALVGLQAPKLDIAVASPAAAAFRHHCSASLHRPHLRIMLPMLDIAPGCPAAAPRTTSPWLRLYRHACTKSSPAGIASPLSGRAYPSLSDPSAWPGPSSGHGGGCFLLCRSARVLIPSRSADRRGGREYSAGRMGVVLPALLAPAIPTARLTGSHHNRWLNADRRISMRSRNARYSAESDESAWPLGLALRRRRSTGGGC
jgi:hypothetical protein